MVDCYALLLFTRLGTHSFNLILNRNHLAPLEMLPSVVAAAEVVLP